MTDWIEIDNHDILNICPTFGKISRYSYVWDWFTCRWKNRKYIVYKQNCGKIGNYRFHNKEAIGTLKVREDKFTVKIIERPIEKNCVVRKVVDENYFKRKCSKAKLLDTINDIHIRIQHIEYNIIEIEERISKIENIPETNDCH